MKSLISMATLFSFVLFCAVPYAAAEPIGSKSYAVIVHTTSANDIKHRLSHNVGQISKAEKLKAMAEDAEQNAENSKSSSMSFIWYIIGGVAAVGALVAILVAIEDPEAE